MSTSLIEEIRFSTFEYQEFNPEHAVLYQRTWEKYIESGQGKALTERQINAFYHQNPEGEGLICVATLKGRWVGSMAAVPTRYGKSASDSRIFYQLADIIVDPDVQGQGVGSRLITELTGVLIERDYPTYAFPNARSSSMFMKKGWRKVREIPTRIFFPQLESVIQRSDSDLTEVNLSDAVQAANQLAEQGRRHNLIIKNGSYIRWRFAESRDAEDYQFFLLRSQDEQTLGLLVTTVFRFSGVRFLVVLDLIVREDADFSSVFSRNFPGHSPLQPGFSTIDPDFPKASFKAALQVPTRFNPRPVLLLTLPNSAEAFEMASSCRFVTADWLGF